MIVGISLIIAPSPLRIRCIKFSPPLSKKDSLLILMIAQFGFRASRSTSQPIHIMRRMLEAFERNQQLLHRLFLDWSKAFDSVTLEAIEAALQYFGVPPLFQKTIMALYSHPQCRVRDSGQISTIHQQTRGLLHGCHFLRLSLI